MNGADPVVANAVLESLARAWAALAPLNVPTAIMGGIAVAFWDRIRATRDVDLLVGADFGADERIIGALTAAGAVTLHDPPVIALDPCRLIQFAYSPPDSFIDIRIDVLLADSPYHQAALARRVPAKISGLDHEISVLSAEDLIIHKLLAGRMIDRADAAGVLRINRAQIDLSYLKKWIVDLGLSQRWSEIWDEAFPGEPVPE
jgi:hypothetical protein